MSQQVEVSSPEHRQRLAVGRQEAKGLGLRSTAGLSQADCVVGRNAGSQTSLGLTQSPCMPPEALQTSPSSFLPLAGNTHSSLGFALMFPARNILNFPAALLQEVFLDHTSPKKIPSGRLKLTIWVPLHGLIPSCLVQFPSVLIQLCYFQG